MLDTRYLDEFVHPQKHVDKINLNMQEYKFSDWDENSANFVLSALLKKHIHETIKNPDNFKKLRDTMRKIGTKHGHKIFIIDSETHQMVLYETLPGNVLQVASSGLHKGAFSFNVGTRLNLFPNETDWFLSDDVLLHNQYEGISDEQLKPFFQSAITQIASFFIYLTLVEVETVIVQPKEKFKAKKYEGFKNQQNVPIKVADLSWSRETVNNFPFGVAGHLRNQACGIGRLERKLIAIEPYVKSGVVRKSGKERILPSQMFGA